MKNKWFIFSYFVLLCFSFLFCSCCFAMDTPNKHDATAEECPDDCTLAELDLLGKEIISLFSPSEYLYIGIGRSPAPIIAWLEAKGHVDAHVQIPISNFKLCKPIVGDKIGFPEFPSDNARENLFRHFDNYLRVHPEFNRKWLIIDVAESGNTLRSAGFALQQYSFKSHLNNSVQMLAIAENNQDKKYYLKMGMHVAMAEYKPGTDYCVTDLEVFLIFGKGKKYAPYEALDWAKFISRSILLQPQPPTTSYGDFLKFIHDWSKSIVLSVFWVITRTSKFYLPVK